MLWKTDEKSKQIYVQDVERQWQWWWSRFDNHTKNRRTYRKILSRFFLTDMIMKSKSKWWMKFFEKLSWTNFEKTLFLAAHFAWPFFGFHDLLHLECTTSKAAQDVELLRHTGKSDKNLTKHSKFSRLLSTRTKSKNESENWDAACR